MLAAVYNNIGMIHSSRSEYGRPAIKKMLAEYSVSLPDFCHSLLPESAWSGLPARQEACCGCGH